MVYGDTKPMETVPEQFVCVCLSVHASAAFMCFVCLFAGMFFCGNVFLHVCVIFNMQGVGMYFQIRIISVTTSNIFNSEDAVGVG